MNAGRTTGPTTAEARAEAQARAKATRGSRASALAAHFAGPMPGTGLLRFAVVTTAVFVVATAVATVADTSGTRLVAALVDLVLFAAGCVLFLVALYDGAQRSRESDISMSGWWFLSGSAPNRVRALLLGNVAVQVVVGFAGASIRFQTRLAFGILVPTLGIALCGLWSARHGMFPKRKDLR